MPQCSRKPWSYNPNAPQLPEKIYLDEKVIFVGTVAATMIYGVAVILFFKCMGALSNPVNRARDGVRWGLVIQAVVMFLLLTVNNGIAFDVQSISNIDYRGFPGVGCKLPPGPFGYQDFISSEAINTAPNVMFVMNQWLADAFLLYRCHVIYGMNYFITAFPFLAYLSSMATGIYLLYGLTRPEHIPGSTQIGIRITTAFYLISLGLNLLLMLMILARLLLHNWNIRRSVGPLAGTSRLYKTVITMLVESFALYAVNLVPFIAFGIKSSPFQFLFAAMLPGSQAIAPLLVIVRVANRTAFGTDGIPSENIGSIHFNSQGRSTGGDGARSGESHVGFAETGEGSLSELGIEAENGVEEVSRS